MLGVSCCGAAVDAWWWGGWDVRRLWTPRFLPSSWSRRTAGGVHLALRACATAYELIAMAINAASAASGSYYIATLSNNRHFLHVVGYVLYSDNIL